MSLESDINFYSIRIYPEESLKNTGTIICWFSCLIDVFVEDDIKSFIETEKVEKRLTYMVYDPPKINQTELVNVVDDQDVSITCEAISNFTLNISFQGLSINDSSQNFLIDEKNHRFIAKSYFKYREYLGHDLEVFCSYYNNEIGYLKTLPIAFVVS
ncbi:hypothetical protein RF11_01081 [Thelohanellus kitauei]|uniref:Uncharacterized protein n=1 Tax=Thelohanellus kitauei TaxID=669202 RepID=A0A0C2MNC5_THEKT|nr:hypothetical protein RF11_01081 [Thelohanellus kitauei]